MCLILTKTSKILTAKRDIPVYKWLYRIHGQLRSPYYFQTWKVGQVVSADSFSTSFGERFSLDIPVDITEVNAGLHSYDKKQAKIRISAGYSVYKAIIP